MLGELEAGNALPSSKDVVHSKKPFPESDVAALEDSPSPNSIDLFAMIASIVAGFAATVLVVLMSVGPATGADAVA